LKKEVTLNAQMRMRKTGKKERAREERENSGEIRHEE